MDGYSLRCPSHLQAEFGSPPSPAASWWRPPYHYHMLNSLEGEEREGELGFMNHLLILLCQEINSVFLCGLDTSWTFVPYETWTCLKGWKLRQASFYVFKVKEGEGEQNQDKNTLLDRNLTSLIMSVKSRCKRDAASRRRQMCVLRKNKMKVGITGLGGLRLLVRHKQF